MTMRGFPINAMGVEHRAFEVGFESMQKGWTETLDQLAASLPVKELVLTREFDGPRLECQIARNAIGSKWRNGEDRADLQIRSARWM